MDFLQWEPTYKRVILFIGTIAIFSNLLMYLLHHHVSHADIGMYLSVAMLIVTLGVQRS